MLVQGILLAVMADTGPQTDINLSKLDETSAMKQSRLSASTGVVKGIDTYANPVLLITADSKPALSAIKKNR